MPEKKGFNLEILKEIIQIMKDEDVNEVCIEQNGIKIQVKRMPAQATVATQGAAILAAQERHSPQAENNLVVIPAPIVGTFYRAPSQDADPYVSVGDEIESDQVICVIEAMKLMNEITAGLNGVIVEILAEDGQPVEYDQPMFRVRPK